MENQSASPRHLTDEEQNFAAALVAFFAALENLSLTRSQIVAAGGDQQAAFMSTIDEDARANAMMQWPTISMMLDTVGMIGG